MQQNLGGTKNLGTLPPNAPLDKVSYIKFQQICRLLTVEMVVLEHIFYSDS